MTRYMLPHGCVACIQERGRHTRELFSVLSRVLWHTHFYLKILSSLYLGCAFVTLIFLNTGYTTAGNIVRYCTRQSILGIYHQHWLAKRYCY